MKKTGIFMIIISIVFLFFVNEHYRYDGYKDVEIPDVGIAKVPESWYCSKTEDGLLYFANMPIENKGCKVYFIQHSIQDYSLEKNQLESGYFLSDYTLSNVNICITLWELQCLFQWISLSILYFLFK